MVQAEGVPGDEVRRGLRATGEGVLLVLALVLAVSGCGDREAAAPAGEHATAFVVAHHAHELAPLLGSPDVERLRAVAADPDVDDALAYVVAAGRPDVERVDLEPRRPNGQVERGQRIGSLVDERLAELRHAVTRAAAEGTDVDLLRALEVAARTGAGTIVVLSSGVSTTDPLDMRVSGWDRDPAELARDLRDRRVLPQLAGRSVVFSGLARTTGSQRPLGLREQAALRDQWLAICTAAGGSCRADDAVRPAPGPVSRLAPPVVDVPSVTTTPGPMGVETVSVPAPLLFAPGRCALLDGAGAAAVLEPLAARLRSGGRTVAISGRTAPVGPGDGLDLATCRATAAADLLRGLGVPEAAFTAVRGDGSSLDPPSASRDNQGRVDPTKLAALRRVVFTLTSAQEIR